MRSLLLAGVALVGVSFAPRPLLADEPATLTQALVEAYYNNATLQGQRAQLRQADETVPTALSGWRPDVELTGTYGRTSENLTSQQQTLFDGLQPVKTPENFNESIGEAQVTENIFNGGKTIAQTRQAKNQVYAARAQLLAQEQTIFLSVVQAYVGVITDQHLLDLQQGNEDVLRQQLKDTQAQFNVGEITMTSVAQAQASLAQADEEVQVAEGNLQNERETFRQLVGDYPADNLTPPQPLDLPVASKDEAAAAALANNPNVIAAEYSNAADQDAVDMAFSVLLPQVQIQASAFHEVGQSYANSQLKGGSVTGQLTIPIFQGGQEYSAIRTARAKAQQSFAGILDAQRTAYNDATQGWVSIVSTRAAILSTNAEIKANAIALDGTEREELVGTRTTLDVLNAQQLLLNSQVQQVQNIGALVNNSYTIASAIGRLTAKDLGLPVQEYDDLKYYHAVKYAGFGTGEAADRDAGIAPDGSLLNTGSGPDASPAP